ncbi:MAG: DUF58 domain-containing protein [Planctomycetota bacterium]
MITETLMRDVRRLQIRARRRVNELFAGEYHAAFRGQGIEFSDVREYQPGDDVRSIDWNVTARAGRPFIKRFVEERQLTVVLAVDRSASDTFGTVAKTKSRLAAEAGALLALSATRNRDRVGLHIFTNRTELFVPPAVGQAHTLRVIRELLGHEPEGRTADLPAAVEELSRTVRRHAIVFLMSDFLVPTDARLEQSLRLLARRHDVIATRISDPRESELPNVGLIDLIDPETGKTARIDAGSRRVRRRFAERRRAQRTEAERLIRRAKCDLLDLSTDRHVGDDLAAFLRSRERRR